MRAPLAPLHFKLVTVLVTGIALAGCASRPGSQPSPVHPSPVNPSPTLRAPQPLPPIEAPLNDGPDPRTPAELMQVPDAVPRVEPIRPGGPNKPYEVAGERYEPLPATERYEARGIASWYGRPFHGRKTANGETFNMYAMTAAHRTLPLPSYARVTNPANGRNVLVRINDRGPFTPGRIIDLSYTAAVKLGIAGLATVRVERVLPQDVRDAPVAVDGDDVPEAPQAVPLADARTAPRETTTNVAARGFWLQLGAYRELQGAITLQKQAEQALPALAHLLTLIELPASASIQRLTRVQAGPFASREEADAAAALVRAKLLLTPVLIHKK